MIDLYLIYDVLRRKLAEKAEIDLFVNDVKLGRLTQIEVDQEGTTYHYDDGSFPWMRHHGKPDGAGWRLTKLNGHWRLDLFE
jgi:hypothetical protein